MHALLCALLPWCCWFEQTRVLFARQEVYGICDPCTVDMPSPTASPPYLPGGGLAQGRVLFACIGAGRVCGAGMGATAAGGRLAWLLDQDKAVCQHLRVAWPNTAVICGAVSCLGGALEKHPQLPAPKVAVISMECAPWTDGSAHARLDPTCYGLRDERGLALLHALSSLVHLKECEGGWMENVKGMVCKKHNSDLALICDTLAAVGVGTRQMFVVTNDEWFGAASRRARVRLLFVRNKQVVQGQAKSTWCQRGEARANAVWEQLLSNLPSPKHHYVPLVDCLVPEWSLPPYEQWRGPWLSPQHAASVKARTRRVAFYSPRYRGAIIMIPEGYGDLAGNGPYLVHGDGVSDNQEYDTVQVPPTVINLEVHRVRKLTWVETGRVNGVFQTDIIRFHQSMGCDPTVGTSRLMRGFGAMQQPMAEAHLAQSFLQALGHGNSVSSSITHQQGGLVPTDSKLGPFKPNPAITTTSTGEVLIKQWKLVPPSSGA